MCYWHFQGASFYYQGSFYASFSHYNMIPFVPLYFESFQLKYLNKYPVVYRSYFLCHHVIPQITLALRPLFVASMCCLV